MSARRPTGAPALCWGTLQDADFVSFVETAARAGYGAVTLNNILCDDARSRGVDIAGALANHGLLVSNIDPLPGWVPQPLPLPGDDFFSRLSRSSVEATFELAHSVGTDLINAPAIFSEATAEAEFVDAFGSLCSRAADEGLRVCLEFMPITPIVDLPTAARIIKQVNASNGGVMLDCWHFRRTGGTLADLRLLPAESFYGVQLDDVRAEPMDDVVEETMNHRLLPGQGVGEVADLVRALKEMGVEVVYDVEIFNVDIRKLSLLEQAEKSLSAAQFVLQG